MIPVYVSNGAFVTRYNGRDYHHIATYAPLLNCDGVEFLMYCVWKDDVKALRSFLKSTKLRFPVTHMDKQIGETLSEYGLKAKDKALKLFERDLITASEIGSEKAVLHLWNGPFSDAKFDEVLELYAQMHDMAARRGILLTTENVTCVKNVCLDHLLKLRALFPFARFTYDTKMAQLHGENELLAQEKYIDLLISGAISHLHLNDTKPMPEMERLPIMHIGDGLVDFDSFFRLLKRSAYSGTATVESTSVNKDGSVDIEKLNRSLDRVRQELNGV